MLVSLNWIKDYVDINCDLESLCKALVSAGFEVESTEKLADNCRGVVVGKIDGLTKHPDADKLQICDINIGYDRVQIVTGANNIKVGDLVPVATDGSSLPNGMNIKKGKLRGVLSQGMLCSGGELKLTEDDYKGAEVDGIMILHEEYPLGTDINSVIGNDDIVMDVGVTANRPDCNSIIGIAREIATVLNLPMKQPDINFVASTTKSIDSVLKVTVSNPELCPRYMAGVVEDIVIKKSPRYIRQRLKAVGLRPINNIVDITNYVLTEIGQPMHAFNYNHVEGGELVVRKANNEKITALDGKVYTLNDTMLTIADKVKPSAIAGVMGGMGSGISSDTTTVVFESAKFMRENIRRTSRKLNLRSDSSTRYERGIDIDSQRLGLYRALTLINQTESGKVLTGIIDICSQDTSLRTVVASVDKINSILGIVVPTQKMVTILNSLQIETKVDGNNLVCKPALFRDDIENENDLAEEIIRLYGYDNINCTLFKESSQTRGGKSQGQKNIDTVKSILVDEGMYETLTYSFTSPKMFNALLLPENSNLRNCVKVINPLGEDLSVMRTTLAYSLLEVTAKNLSRNNKDFSIFEVANTYIATEEPMVNLPIERTHVCVAMTGEKVDFYKLKSIISKILLNYGLNENYLPSNVSYLHSGISADVIVDGKNIGYFGLVHPKTLKAMDIRDKVFVAELDLVSLNEMYNNSYTFAPIPKFPSIERDIAILVADNITADDLIKSIKQANNKMLSDVWVFDVYKGKGIENGYKSVAIKLSYQSLDRTLTDDEIAKKIEKTLQKLAQDYNAKLR